MRFCVIHFPCGILVGLQSFFHSCPLHTFQEHGLRITLVIFLKKAWVRLFPSTSTTNTFKGSITIYLAELLILTTKFSVTNEQRNQLASRVHDVRKIHLSSRDSAFQSLNSWCGGLIWFSSLPLPFSSRWIV